MQPILALVELQLGGPGSSCTWVHLFLMSQADNQDRETTHVPGMLSAA